jgi:putative transposase
MNSTLQFPMARLTRIVVSGSPHHVTQRGNRRERVFFDDSDYALYRDLFAQPAGNSASQCGPIAWQA